VIEDVWQKIISNVDLGLVFFVAIGVIGAVLRGDTGSDTGEDAFDDSKNISPADRVDKIQDDSGNPLKRMP
jgi:hypothetical protein